MPNIHDVARHAGVSTKTVSRVLNSSPHVARETRARVNEAIKALDFHPHSWARNLARRRSQSIGVVIPLAPQYVFSHLFFSQILQGIGEILEQNSYDLMLYAQIQERPYAELWKERRVDALILMSVPIRDPRVVELHQAEAPFVLTSRPDKPGSELDRALSWVDADHTAGAEAAVEHLLMLGHRRLALVNGPPNLMVSQLRAEGFRRAVANFGEVIDQVSVNAEFSVEAGRALGSSLLDSPVPPTAVFCGDDTLAIGIIEAARVQGLRVPDDLSVVGFDDMALSPYLDPPLTTVRQPAEKKGRLAAANLLRILEGKGPSKAEHVLLPTELIVRSSTAPVPSKVPDRG